MTLLEDVLEKESFGTIEISPELHFIHIKDLGDDRLRYSNRNAYDWITTLEQYYKERQIPFDILTFLPASETYGPWCTDGPSIGYKYNNRNYFCLESFLDHSRKAEDKPAVALSIHKLFHGFGYNHISQENRPMNLMEWNIGLPKTRIFPFNNNGRDHRIIFDKHIMKVLGFLEKNDFEKECLDNQGFICRESNHYFCENSYDVSCIDSDQDNIVDAQDDYLFTPPGTGDAPDMDADGIPDALDLCHGDLITLETNIQLRKTKAVVDRDRVEITIAPAPMIKGVNIFASRSTNGFLTFTKGVVRRVKGNKLLLNANTLSPTTRLQIFYESRKGKFYKPFYLYLEPQYIEYVHEKEWYYFSRFGCDIPLGVNFSDNITYDRNLDGLPDEERFAFARQITNDYDWDSDGIPDRADNLPTVPGKCSNEYVKGVPDSDDDGWCDPAYFDFSNSSGTSEGDLTISLKDDISADECPYVYSNDNNGCP